MIKYALPLLAVLGLTACSSSDAHVSVPDDVTSPCCVSRGGAAGKSGVSVYCSGDDTWFEKDGYTVVFVGRKGYRGELGQTSGTLVVGDVEMSYGESRIAFTGPLAQGSFEGLRPGWHATIDQAGFATAR
jgi:hypothetical protein